MDEMAKSSQIFRLFLIVLCSLFMASSQSSANNLAIGNVVFGQRNLSANTVTVTFDVSWGNSWRTKINHDAVWVTTRLYNPSTSPISKKLCQVSASGINPTGMSAGSNASLELDVPSDKFGVFIRPSSYGKNATVTSVSVQLIVNYDSCGFSDSDTVSVSVYGVEMVYVPQGAFYAGDNGTSTAAFDQGSSDTDPWYISSESSISATNPASNGYRYVSNGNTDESATGSSFSISSSYPKGYSPFYVMKYEVSEGDWVEFANSLPSAGARTSRDLTDNLHKNSDSVKYRNTMSCSGSPLTCSTSRPARAASYLSWMDVAAFLDWAALRPISELEYEKIARGPVLAVRGEFAWGSTTITAASTVSSGAETGAETVTTTNANTHYNNMTLSGGDTGSGADYQLGPLRGGIFSTSSSTRESAGAGYYGVMELSGNLRERAVTVGNVTGRNFSATHGDGVLTAASGYEGNATNSDWPGIDGAAERGVTGAAGSGFRGGAWDDQSSGARLRISDRADAANTSASALNNAGGRGARTHNVN